ncbi:MAG: DUF948 domain-containing protein [Candidatus Kapaibacterium sp.]
MIKLLKKYLLNKWAKLIAAFAFIVIFIYLIMPLIAMIPPARELGESNRKYGIPAGTLYYSETPQFGEADNYMKNSRKYNSKSMDSDKSH